MEAYKRGIKVGLVTGLLNILLAILKIVAGIMGNSKAILADGIHSLSDVFSTFLVIVGLNVSSKEADEKHPYGHEKYESIFGKILSLFLMGTGLFIGYESLSLLISGNIEKPGNIALIAAFISIVSKEAMYWYTMKVAKDIKSIALEADAWHHRSDAFSSIGTFLGVLGARFGFLALDPLAGILVSVIVLKIGIQLYLKSINELVDESASELIEKNIKTITLEVNGVKGIKDLKTRVFGSKVYVDLEIYVDGHLSVIKGHKISEIVHDKLEGEIEDIKHCMVHIEPYIEKNKLEG